MKTLEMLKAEAKAATQRSHAVKVLPMNHPDYKASLAAAMALASASGLADRAVREAKKALKAKS